MTPNPQSPCEGENEIEETFAISDSCGHTYRLDLFENTLIWSLKAFDGFAHAAHANCHKQGETLFLDDLHVKDAAIHRIQGLARLKCWLGLPAQGRVENYRNRGLGSALLNFVLDRARARGLQRLTGNLAPVDLKESPALPDWYRKRGFQVTLEPDKLTGTIEIALS